jgi:hypothetical protein
MVYKLQSLQGQGVLKQFARAAGERTLDLLNFSFIISSIYLRAKVIPLQGQSLINQGAALLLFSYELFRTTFTIC